MMIMASRISFRFAFFYVYFCLRTVTRSAPTINRTFHETISNLKWISNRRNIFITILIDKMLKIKCHYL